MVEECVSTLWLPVSALGHVRVVLNLLSLLASDPMRHHHGPLGGQTVPGVASRYRGYPGTCPRKGES